MGERSPADVSALSRDWLFSLKLLSRIYEDDGQEVYDQESLSAVIRELRTFWDLPSVAEVYSVPRVAAQAMTVANCTLSHLRQGFSIDIGTLEPDGNLWNLEDDIDFRYLMQWREEEKPFLLCGSPPCNAFSRIQTWSRSRIKPGTEQELRRTGLLHLSRSIELYRAQMRDGLYFLHEFPSGSTSVLEPVLQDLLKTPGVMKVKGPICVWGMTSSDA